MTTDTSQSDSQSGKDTWIAKYQNHARRVAEARPANKDALFDALTRAGITKVVVNFDGYGDSGQVERIDVHAGEAEAKLPKDQIELIEPVYGDPENVDRSTHTLSDAIETLVYAFLEQTHGGWEDNDGAYGDFTFDVERWPALFGQVSAFDKWNLCRLGSWAAIFGVTRREGVARPE